MNENLSIKELEDHAFYESGLSADGCLEKLDDYTRKAIEKYGRILLKKQKQDFIDGFEGCCYCCEPVGETNIELEKENKKLRDCLMEIHKDGSKLSLSNIEKVLNLKRT
jgi:hypothetical protein